MSRKAHTSAHAPVRGIRESLDWGINEKTREEHWKMHPGGWSWWVTSAAWPDGADSEDCGRFTEGRMKASMSRLGEEWEVHVIYCKKQRVTPRHCSPNTSTAMPIDLPNQPNGPTRLPPQPDDPPTLTDISNSVTYNQRLLVSHRKEPVYCLSFNFSLTCIFHSEAGTQNSASSDDIGRGREYQVQLVQAQAGQGEQIFNMNWYLRE